MHVSAASCAYRDVRRSSVVVYVVHARLSRCVRACVWCAHMRIRVCVYVCVRVRVYYRLTAVRARWSVKTQQPPRGTRLGRSGDTESEPRAGLRASPRPPRPVPRSPSAPSFVLTPSPVIPPPGARRTPSRSPRTELRLAPSLASSRGPLSFSLPLALALSLLPHRIATLHTFAGVSLSHFSALPRSLYVSLILPCVHLACARV